MKLLPQSRPAIVRCVIILSVFVALVAIRRPDRLVSYYFSEKKEGDILFQSLPHGDLVDAIEGISHSEWSHCGILVKHGGKWQVAEAIGEVRYTPLHLWVLRGRQFKVEAYRVNPPPAGIAPALNAGVAKLRGLPYDFSYAPDDAEIYCSELVHKVYDRELGVSIGSWEQLGHLNWKPYEAFIRRMENGQLPLDRAMITPVALTRSPLVTRVFPR
ncbi:MAG: hypothetical protein K0R17_107 [Rariglobus sp.]|jgi:hypothetical protein|nr:hypothetical protein [Rariglobus sp.]